MAKLLVQNKFLPHLAAFRTTSRAQEIARFGDMPEDLRQQLAYERYQDALLINDRGAVLHDLMVEMRHRIEMGDTTPHPEMMHQEAEKLLQQLPPGKAESLFGGMEVRDVLQCVAGEANRMALIGLGEKLVESNALHDRNAQRAVERMIHMRDTLAHPGRSQTDGDAIAPQQALEDLRLHLQPVAEREAQRIKQAAAAVSMYGASNLSMGGLHQALCRHEIALKDILHSAELAEPKVRINKAVWSSLKRNRNLLVHNGPGYGTLSSFVDPDLDGRPLGNWVELAQKHLTATGLVQQDTRLFPSRVSQAGEVLGKYTALLTRAVAETRQL